MSNTSTDLTPRLGRWPLLLGVFLVVTLPVLTGCPEQERDPAVTTVDPIDPGVEEAPITSITMITGATDPLLIEGRDVQLLNVRVDQVLGDTAIYVTQGTPTGAAPGATPGTTPGATDQPGAQPGTQPGTQAGARDRLLVVYDTGILGMGGLDDDLTTGAMVDVFGTVRVRDGARTGVGTTPGTTPGAADQPETQPGTTPGTQPGVQPGAQRDNVYVRADRIERHDPARAGTAPGTAPGTGATAPGTAPGTTPGTAPGTAPGTTPGTTPQN